MRSWLVKKVEEEKEEGNVLKMFDKIVYQNNFIKRRCWKGRGQFDMSIVVITVSVIFLIVEISSRCSNEIDRRHQFLKHY